VKCHQPKSCVEFPKLHAKTIATCVNCDLPLQPSKLIISNSNGKQFRPMLRSHWINIYASLHAP
jgi:hypothetical protein